ncbi:hypothetical protein BSLG_005404 [Batrachochytrium salamandrivorans]|nr:hypothetical protein BSLG_005404 [Batrachochytrium salamandrivorans]
MNRLLNHASSNSSNNSVSNYAQRPRHLGVTPPISENPLPKEIACTEQLVATLRDYGQYESEEEAQKREVVLGKIDAIFKEFVRSVSIKNGLPDSLANEVGGKIFTFGSYRLGVHGKKSDIDTLCVAPKHVKREDFLEHMYDILKARTEVTEITAVADAYVPIIKLEFSDISIDLVFARLALPTVSEELDLSDDSLLKNLDDRCIRSLNGSRVTDDILRLVPNVETFRIALRCVKLWAAQRAIYSNVMGFFGGVAWAILVARVCQLYPCAAAGEVVSKFFQIMYRWEWPLPVLLKPIEEGPLAVRVWNPKIYPQDKAHRMPIITPAYPSMCSTHNVTVSTQTVTTQEFERAAATTDKIMLGREKWTVLFQKNDFFHRYKYYLQVIASSNHDEKQLMWAGFVESRLRQLVMKLELAENLDIAHPYIKGFEKKTDCYSENDQHDVAHGQASSSPEALAAAAAAAAAASAASAASAKSSVAEDQNGTMSTDVGESAKGSASTNGNSAAVEPTGQDATSCVDDGHDAVLTAVGTPIWTTTFYVGLAIKPKDANCVGSRKLDITWPTVEFIKMVKSWDKFEDDSMGIVIQHIKSAGLPADVFNESEPAPALKKRTKSQNNVASTGLENPNKKLRSSGILAETQAGEPSSAATLTPIEPVETNEGQGEVPVYADHTEGEAGWTQAAGQLEATTGSADSVIKANAIENTTMDTTAGPLLKQEASLAATPELAGLAATPIAASPVQQQPVTPRSYSEAAAAAVSVGHRFGNGGLSGMGIPASSARRAPEIKMRLGRSTGVSPSVSPSVSSSVMTESIVSTSPSTQHAVNSSSSGGGGGGSVRSQSSTTTR